MNSPREQITVELQVKIVPYLFSLTHMQNNNRNKTKIIKNTYYYQFSNCEQGYYKSTVNGVIDGTVVELAYNRTMIDELSVVWSE